MFYCRPEYHQRKQSQTSANMVETVDSLMIGKLMVRYKAQRSSPEIHNAPNECKMLSYGCRLHSCESGDNRIGDPILKTIECRKVHEKARRLLEFEIDP